MRFLTNPNAASQQPKPAIAVVRSWNLTTTHAGPPGSPEDRG